MMDERELILGKGEQEQKEALLPKAILTSPWDNKNNHERQQKLFSLLFLFGIHLWPVRGAMTQPHICIFTELYTQLRQTPDRCRWESHFS